MECAFIGVIEEANKVCLRSLLEGKEGCALHLQIRLYVTSNLADKTLEGCLPHQKVCVLLERWFFFTPPKDLARLRAAFVAR